MTVFEYGLECRMRHALELLHGHTMSICQVAENVGYQHQTSFTAAFGTISGFCRARRGYAAPAWSHDGPDVLIDGAGILTAAPHPRP